MTVKIGIIGGTGLEKPELLLDRKEVLVETAYGKPSDALITGKIEGIDVVILSRHGRDHSINPTNVNFRANLLALKNVGCTHILVSTACGSLKEEIQPGHFVIPDQFIDRTTKRIQTFYDGQEGHFKGVCHIPSAIPFCEKLRSMIGTTASELGFVCHPSGTVVCIEGPRFSSKAESFLFKSWGADLVNMTIVPEVVLAAELGIPYAALAIGTDYDCWRTETEAVNVENVYKTLSTASERACSIFKAVIPKIAGEDWKDTFAALEAQRKIAVQ